MTTLPSPSHVFAAAREATVRIAVAAHLGPAQLADLERTMLDFEAARKLDEVMVARMARQGVPVSRLLGCPGQQLLAALQAGTPTRTLAQSLAFALASGSWTISRGDAGLNPYKREK